MISDAMLQQAAEELATAINESYRIRKNVFFNSLQNLREKWNGLQGEQIIRFCIEIYGWLQVYYWYF